MLSRAVVKVADAGGAQAREIGKLSTLLSASQALSATLDLKGGLEQVLEAVCRHYRAVRATAVLLADDTGEVELEASSGAVALREQKLTRLSAPIMLDARTAGVIGIDLRIKAARDCPRIVKFLGQVATIVAGALKKHRLLRIERQRLLDENASLRQELTQRYEFSNLIGSSASMRQVFRQLSQVAQTSTPVLLRGEPGTGKELLAHTIHSQSNRAEKPFLTIGCAGLPAGLIESELFGFERSGAHGVRGTKSGRLEEAEGGTVFLDEIGDLPITTQVRLLRVVRDRELERPGGTRTVRINVRVLAATSKDLEHAVASGAFLEDLYYLLVAVSIGVPPLRERRPDILLLANHFLTAASRDHRKSVNRISTAAVDMLVGYHWPGNVRELADVIDRGVIASDGPVVHVHHLPPTLQASEVSRAAGRGSLRQLLEAVERDALADALKSARGNRAKAARLLSTTERIFNYRVRKYGIDWKRFKSTAR
ncbi:MAG: sigma-54-dependent Fis family transcriptional regulator [Acidobacteria bacterium]|nr:MAG: sigma-54-dependent Fis family transcriptional regulator [Acidobacteriota bacterium]